MTEMIQRFSFSFRELTFKELLIGGIGLVLLVILAIAVRAL